MVYDSRIPLWVKAASHKTEMILFAVKSVMDFWILEQIGTEIFSLVSDPCQRKPGSQMNVCFTDGKKLDELVVFAINQQLKQMKMDMKNLETQIRQKQPELDGKIAKLQAKIERNLEYRKRAYEQFMDEVLSKEEYLELKQMYETENQKYQKELSELNHEEQRQRAAVNETKIWLEHFNRRRITVKQLTREALVELVDKIYVYPEQKIDIYFKFASVESSPDRILEKDGVI